MKSIWTLWAPSRDSAYLLLVLVRRLEELLARVSGMPRRVQRLNADGEMIACLTGTRQALRRSR